MPITVEQAAEYIGADPVRDADKVTRALGVAEALVSQALAGAWRSVPTVIRDECVLRTAYSIFKQGGSGEGGLFNGADGTAVPGQPNDPLRKSRDLISHYVDRL